MERPTSTTLRIGAWYVNPASGQISRNGETARLEARTMRLLLCLAEHAGEVVSMDDLLDQVWSGVIVTQDSVYQAVASLRRLLGDDPKQPIYIATVPRLGYRMVAQVSPWDDQSIAQATSSRTSGDEPAAPATTPAATPGLPRLRAGFTWAAGAVFGLALVALFCSIARSRTVTTPPHLPLLRSPKNPSQSCPFSISPKK